MGIACSVNEGFLLVVIGVFLAVQSRRLTLRGQVMAGFVKNAELCNARIWDLVLLVVWVVG